MTTPMGNGGNLYAGLRHCVTAPVPRVGIRSARNASVWLPIGWAMEAKKKGTRKRNAARGIRASFISYRDRPSAEKGPKGEHARWGRRRRRGLGRGRGRGLELCLTQQYSHASGDIRFHVLITAGYIPYTRASDRFCGSSRY